MMQMAPISVAAFNHPNPIGPTAKISLAKTGTMATAPPKKTANKSRDKAPSTSLVLNTNRNPSFTLSSPVFSPFLFNAGLALSWYRNKNPTAIKLTMMMSAPVLPIPAIKKPAAAWPVTEADSQMPWFQVVADCNWSRGTMAANIVPNKGPVNARMIPVKNITI